MAAPSILTLAVPLPEIGITRIPTCPATSTRTKKDFLIPL